MCPVRIRTNPSAAGWQSTSREGLARCRQSTTPVGPPPLGFRAPDTALLLWAPLLTSVTFVSMTSFCSPCGPSALSTKDGRITATSKLRESASVQKAIIITSLLFDGRLICTRLCYFVFGWICRLRSEANCLKIVRVITIFLVYPRAS